ncbi:MAG: hypothetical protein DWQ31_10535 [Planctomycetota bacterium]|nr:MAG: hypothetical protein DWQ31_10535 [Planctomycetota bacterium]REJ91104.1 MAG: hypothetical protein DWQ35_15200 [Planctomycetota bacterium]REK27646.1 MAG: hypothetical protein DWQ42_06700 [Planctomycetota bacterium]REK38511.1 MAG: hypothetical protein DWQ46_20485 [Planctomycetota bacterium]
MKTERRHELQSNALAAWLMKTSQSLGPYMSWIIAGAIAVVLLLVFLQIRSGRQNEGTAALQQEISTLSSNALAALRQNPPKFFEFQTAATELKDLAEEHEGTRMGQLAALAVGDTYMQQGEVMLRGRRAEAYDAMETAAEYYSKVIEDETAPQLWSQLARYRRGRTYEWRNQLNPAIEDYEATEGPYARLAAQHAAFLKRPSTREFYDEFDRLDLRPPQIDPTRVDPTTGFSDQSGLDEELGEVGLSDPFGGGPATQRSVLDRVNTEKLGDQRPLEADPTQDVDTSDGAQEPATDAPPGETSGDEPESGGADSQGDAQPVDPSDAAPTDDDPSDDAQP